MFKKIFITFTAFFILSLNSDLVYSAETNEQSYTTLGVVDLKTFNEYRYKITDSYLDLRSKFEVDGKIDTYVSAKILQYATEGLKYLPDSLSNKNYYNYLKTSIEKGVKYPENSSFFEEIATSIENFLEKTTIQKVSGNVEAFPSTGNAPLTVTLRGNVKDPTGTKLENHNYTWWINEGGKRKVIGNKISLTYVFKEEGNYSVFLDVTSNHKNSLGNSDVLPFSSRADIVVKEKIASIILKVNNENLGQQEELKFLPDVARYGLLFDATSSTPTSGAKFTRTEWDFGNGVTRVNDGAPNVERVAYGREGEYTVKLKLTTNENKSVERKFILKINNPIATIRASNEEGFIGDKFTFSANPTGSSNNLGYSWKIIDIKNDKEILNKNSSTFTHTFSDKGKYNIQLYVTDPSGNTDLDYKIIHINSRAPEARFIYSVPYPNKPNTIFLDATSSFDADFSDDGKLKYSWIINGDRVNLDSPNFNGSNGYYTFSSVGDQSVVLEVTDPDDMTSQKTEKIKVNSILSVEFFAFPRVAQIGKTFRFVADSPQANFYEWDFGDGKKQGGKTDTISHVFDKSGVYNVKLKVVDQNDNSNTFSKNVYVGDTDTPFAFINIKDNLQNFASYRENECNGEGAYILNRVNTFSISGDESIDVTGENTGLSYSWKIGDVLYSSQSFTKKFDELGCTKVKLTVKSNKSGKESTKEVYVKVENLKPTLSSLDIRVKDLETDPVLVTLNAIGAKDADGVIQSYLWYYYTDVDPEPQDFRATKTDTTTFVLPKVTGNYYFVVVMKDNNETRSNSEDLSGSKYFITLTGDNVNTPILDLKVNNSSVSIGDEVVFTSNVENILGQNLNSKVSFSWDFDGDGFYDKETQTNTVTHKYESSGEKYAKVKVKHKGFSNTKTVVVNVANVLKPDFDYVSIGNDYIFFDTSLGSPKDYSWDMGDGNKITKPSFKYTYDDGKSTHLVTLKISEGTKSREVTKKVVKDLSNFIKSKKSGLIVFSNQLIDDNDTITLEDNSKKLYFYLGSNSGSISNYVADFDINYDSDLNGGNDDDEDNRFQDSYFSKNAILVDLNEAREQVVRLYTKDISGKLLGSKDIKIVKNYIDESIDVNSIVFEGVSDSVKFKLEKIKLEVSNFPKEHKLKGLMYVQKLKEEWNDDREKTNVIIEFEGFIQEINLPKSKELIDLLESLLIEGEADKSEKSIAYNALKNLIPKGITCIEPTSSEIKDGLTCYDLLVAKLDVIGENYNIDENKELGKIILENIAADTNMTVKQKTDFKAILNTFVYGSVSNIPVEEKEEVVQETQDSSSKGLFDYLSIIIKIFGVIIVIVLILVGIYFVYYKSKNNDKDKSFTDFISDKTSQDSSKNINNSKVEDILGNDDSFNFDFETTNKNNVITENKQEIPDWLKGNFSEDPLLEEKEKETPIEINPEIEPEVKSEVLPEFKVDDSIKSENNSDEKVQEIPDWLKGSFSEDPLLEEKEKETSIKINSEIEPEIKSEVLPEFKVDDSNKLENNSDEKVQEIPDWLKGSFQNSENELSKEEEPKLETKEELDAFTKIDIEDDLVADSQENLPDWLKGSFDSKSETKGGDDFLDTLIQNNNNEDVVKNFDNESNNKTKKTTQTKKTSTKKNSKTSVDNLIEKEDNKNDTELWDDGMKIPDWLKTDDDK
ncbi:PKD domain-containing protein [Candidatus Gracilibacteria bacterium]|nr:PKD domain-containing protein [Candidatus Gracilibacteria bacterium]